MGKFYFFKIEKGPTKGSFRTLRDKRPLGKVRLQRYSPRPPEVAEGSTYAYSPPPAQQDLPFPFPFSPQLAFPASAPAALEPQQDLAAP